ncbi:MAG: tetratricopeptide repeat protein [Bacteroidota bacterium]
MKQLSVIVFFFMSLFLPAQDNLVDSLKKALKIAKHDTTRCNLLNDLAENAGDDEWQGFNSELKKLAEANLKKHQKGTFLYKFYLKHQATSLGNMAVVYADDGNLKKALEYYHKSLEINTELNSKAGMASCLNGLGFIYFGMGNADKALMYGNKSLKLSEEINDRSGVAAANNFIGDVYARKGDIANAVTRYEDNIKIYQELKEDRGLATSYNKMASVYGDQGDVPKAIDFFSKSLAIQSKIGDIQGMSANLYNLGAIYFKQEDYDKALEFYNKSVAINLEQKNQISLAMAYSAIGVLYYNLKDLSKALEYYEKSITTSKETGNKSALAITYFNLGDIYRKKNEMNKALGIYQESLKLYEELEDKDGTSSILFKISDIYMKQKNYGQAAKVGENSLKLSQELGYPYNISQSSLILSRVYSEMGKWKEAYTMHLLHKQMNDSLRSQTSQKAAVRSQFKYEYEKKAAADSIKSIEEKKIARSRLEVSEAKLKQEKTQRIALYGGLCLVLLFAGFMFNRFRVTNRQKKIIEAKEQETQRQNIIISQQKHLVEEKHREITDSINYAERIQRSFMATKELLDEHLKDYFVFFKPKDVVSGDFYWASKLQNDCFILVTADSTGHGVPGAIMSLLNITSLEKAIEHSSDAGEILDHTRQTIINRLKKDGSVEGGKDGMDCSLTMYDFKNRKLYIAAANNPVWIVRGLEVIEVKPDKMPVGKHDKQDISFTRHEFDLKPGDVVYTLTDGYPDQFGGALGKKFMSKNLRSLLSANAHLPMTQQKEILITTFTNWISNLEQVDDVTVIGIRV